MTFDEALKLNNIPNDGLTGVTPVNSSLWTGLLSDLATSIYSWECSELNFKDLLNIEKYIFNKTTFALVRIKEELTGGYYLDRGFRVLPCTVERFGLNFKPKSITILWDCKPKNILSRYEDDYILFDNLTYTYPALLVKKYSDIFAKLDALYEQNIDKLSLPVIAITNKNLKNDLLNIFKRAKVNALFSMVNGENRKDSASELFYNPQVEFLLDKINNERKALMSEFLQELGINPISELEKTSQYVNDRAIFENSLISKYFSCCLNKYRDNFVKKVKSKFNIELRYYPSVRTKTDERGAYE